MDRIYDSIGKSYEHTRTTDPVIAGHIWRQLAGAANVLNLGAGTGSYEPEDMPVVAVEPSATMIMQRPRGSGPVVQAFADALPFADQVFSAVMSVLSVHHWHNRDNAFAEICRVATGRAVILTWVPEVAEFWLTRDYFPDLLDIDKPKFPSIADFTDAFGAIQVLPVPIPFDCRDGFLGAYWRRPHYYLDAKVRAGMSTFAELADPEPALKRLGSDIESGQWHKRNSAIINADKLDLGYRIVVADLQHTGKLL